MSTEPPSRSSPPLLHCSLWGQLSGRQTTHAAKLTFNFVISTMQRNPTSGSTSDPPNAMLRSSI